MKKKFITTITLESDYDPTTEMEEGIVSFFINLQNNKNASLVSTITTQAENSQYQTKENND